MTDTIRIEQVIAVGQYGAEFRIWVNGVVRCYRTGTLAQAEAEAARIVRGPMTDHNVTYRPLAVSFTVVVDVAAETMFQAEDALGVVEAQAELLQSALREQGIEAVVRVEDEGA